MPLPHGDHSANTSLPLRRHRGPLTPDERAVAQDAFLDSFKVTANVSRSAKMAGVHRGTVYDWRHTDPAFATRYAEAEEDARDVLRAVILDRAVTGWDEPVVSVGQVIRRDNGDPWLVRRYDSRLLAALAAVRLPEWRAATRQQVEITGTSGGPVEVSVKDELAARLTAFIAAGPAPTVLCLPDEW
jgi:hypothetical protein